MGYAVIIVVRHTAFVLLVIHNAVYNYTPLQIADLRCIGPVNARHLAKIYCYLLHPLYSPPMVKICYAFTLTNNCHITWRFYSTILHALRTQALPKQLLIAYITDRKYLTTNANIKHIQHIPLPFATLTANCTRFGVVPHLNQRLPLLPQPQLWTISLVSCPLCTILIVPQSQCTL